MEDPTALYVHIPFCKHKCHYCDFNTYEVEGQPVNAYLEALEMEMKRTVEATPPPALESIFIGGGTPTIFGCTANGTFACFITNLFSEKTVRL